MTWAMLRAIVILPGTALVFVPALLLWATGGLDAGAETATPGQPGFWLAAALGAAGTGAVTEIKVSADPALGPGEAQIAWSQGGAEIDADAIAEAALEHFRRQLERCLQPGA